MSRLKSEKKISNSSVKLPVIDDCLSRQQRSRGIKPRAFSIPVIQCSGPSGAKPTKLAYKNRAEPARLRTQTTTIADQQGNSNANPIEKQQLGITLRDFEKAIQQNREQIKKGTRSRALNAVVATANTISYECPDTAASTLSAKPKHELQIFKRISMAMRRSMAAYEMEDGEAERAATLDKLLRKIHKFNSQNENTQLEIKFSSESQSSKLKKQGNDCEWRRVQLQPSSKALHFEVHPSTYETEDERLSKLILRTDACLCKYWQSRKMAMSLLQAYQQ